MHANTQPCYCINDCFTACKTILAPARGRRGCAQHFLPLEPILSHGMSAAKGPPDNKDRDILDAEEPIVDTTVTSRTAPDYKDDSIFAATPPLEALRLL
eukprot:2072305-Alexandrium_andersonii.AAC.1